MDNGHLGYGLLLAPFRLGPPSATIGVVHHSAIEITGLAVRAGEKVILPPLTMSLRAGQKALLRGPSGSGKTTLIRTIMGFAEPHAGGITVGGVQMDGRTAWALRQQYLCCVAQEPDPGPGTVRQCLMRPFGFRANRRIAWDEPRALGLLRMLLVPHGAMDTPARELSGGEKRRVMLASAVMLARPVLILDEPTSGLDPASAARVADMVLSLGDVTVLIVSHDALWRGRVDTETTMEDACRAS